MVGQLHVLITRSVLATFVILHHSFFFAGESDPLHGLGTSFGEIGVVGFFFMSGSLLATKASESRVVPFLVRRLARIWPGLTAGTVLAMVLALASQLQSNTAISPMTYFSFFYTNVSLVNPNRQYVIDGAFSQNLASGTLNGSLWSITFEVWCYIVLISLMFLARKSRARLRVWSGLIVIATSVLAVLVENIDTVQIQGWFYHLLPAFFLGVFFGTHDRTFSGYSRAAMLTASFFCAVTILDFAVNSVLWSFERSIWILLALFVSIPLTVQTRASNLFDPTLGLYVFSYPIGQTIALFFSPSINLWALFSLTFLVSLALAYLSFRYLEWPFMLRISESKR
jgi:peptidoglycan/LPS O-acetylase OafA/YrhL